MYAVIRNGGKQYRVSEGDLVKLERFEGELGHKVTLSEVLLVSNGETVLLGTPLVKEAKIVAEVVKQSRAEKVTIIKFKRRKHHLKKQGHRQYYTTVEIKSIEAPGVKALPPEKSPFKKIAKKKTVKKTVKKATTQKKPAAAKPEKAKKAPAKK